MTAASRRANFDDPDTTLVMTDRPMAQVVSGVMPVARVIEPAEHPVSGVMPVARGVATNDDLGWGSHEPLSAPSPDVLSSYPPAGAEPTPLSVPPIASLSAGANRAVDESDGRGRTVFAIGLAFLVGTGGAYGYQVETNAPPALRTRNQATDERSLLGIDMNTIADPGVVRAPAPKPRQPSTHAASPNRPKKTWRGKRKLEGRDLLSEGLD